MFDGPTTRGLLDTSTATMWAVDSFVCMVPDGVTDVHDLEPDFVVENMRAMNSLVSPWHQWLDPVAYGAHANNVEALGVLTVASAHGPVLTGEAIHDAFDVVRSLAGTPIIPGPGPELLVELQAQALAPA